MVFVSNQMIFRKRFIILPIDWLTLSKYLPLLEECQNDFERWIYVLKNMETLKRLPFKARKSVFEKLEKIVDIASLSKEERIKYDESIKVYRDNLATIEYAEQKGMKEGLEKGLEKGRKEANEATARNLKKLGIPLPVIMDATGLSTEEIEKL